MNNLEDYTPTNQTEFAGQSPVFETPTSTQSQINRPVEDDPAPKTPFFKTKKGIMVTTVAVFFTIILIVLLILVQNKKEESPIIVPDEEEEVLSPELDPLRKKINELRSQLNKADPTKQSLLFPPVNMKIEIRER